MPFRFPGRNSGATPTSSGKRTQKSKSQSETERSGNSAAPKSQKKGDNADLPDKMKKLRACMICSLIKTEVQFDEDGCDNCESFLQLSGTRGAVLGYTSENFEGMIGMISPDQSWVSKWQRIGTFKPGMYAVNVRGEVSKWVKEEMSNAGLVYYCRDATKRQ